jgi:hypothetical protein
VTEGLHLELITVSDTLSLECLGHEKGHFSERIIEKYVLC